MNTLSPQGEEFIMRDGHEGIRLKPYLCQANVPTIGAGCTTYENGQKVKLTDPPITHARAISLFRNRAQTYINCVNRVVKVELQQHEFDALVSLCFNCGETNFTNSQVVKNLNAGNRHTAKEWAPKSFITAAGQPSRGLEKRRQDELKLFMTGEYN